MQPRRHDFRVVHDEHVAIAQQPRQIAHHGVTRCRRTLVDEQPRRVTRLNRCLCDQPFRKLVVDVGELHAAAIVAIGVLRTARGRGQAG